MTDRPGLSPMQSRVLEVIKDYIRANGFSPSFRDIAKACGLKSNSTPYAAVHALLRRGYLVAEILDDGHIAKRSMAIAQNGPANVVILVRPDGKYLRTECTGDVTIKVRTEFPKLEGANG